jgi:hypothetical protein
VEAAVQKAVDGEKPAKAPAQNGPRSCRVKPQGVARAGAATVTKAKGIVGFVPEA